MDFNKDGYKDLVVGDRDGYINFFERAADKTLKAGVKLQANGAAIKVTNNSSPFVVDWNGDGLVDLLAGSDASSDGIRLYPNGGTAAKHSFMAFSKLKTGSLTIAYSREQIKAVDLNKDGKTDLLVGNGLIPQSRVYYYENTGTSSAPALKAPVALMTKDNMPVYPEMGYDITFDAADWNNDGAPDIVMGDYNGNKIKLFLGDKVTSLAAPGPSKEPGGAFHWNAGREILSVQLNLERAHDVSLSICSIDGRTVRRHDEGHILKGVHRFSLPLGDLAAGIYRVRAKAGDLVRTCLIAIAE